MLQSCKNMLGYEIEASDGPIGKVHDFYFDDRLWTIRYAVADTSRWLPGRKVLLSPDACSETMGETRQMHVDLTRDQIKNSPDVQTDEPVSRQEEEKLRAYYGWSTYWPMATFAPALSDYGQLEPLPVSGPDTSENTDSQDHHLRSLREVSHYHVKATDGEVGRTEDMILEDEDWQLRYLVVDTGHWLSSRKVLISLEWIREISWSGSEVVVDVDRQAIENSPPFSPEKPVNREYEVLLYDYYGRPCYWVHAK
jgi:hypothetical protein